MPNYEVHHSFPLGGKQKQSLATAITKLHATTFHTPSAFVHVSFQAHDATSYGYFVGGRPHETSSNRIYAYVRTSTARAKADFDAMAAQIEEMWHDAVSGEKIAEGKDAGKRQGEVDQLERDAEAKKLLLVSFRQLVAVREMGMAVPEAGKEGEWFKENRAYFKEMSEGKGKQEFADLLEEMETREDLKRLVG